MKGSINGVEKESRSRRARNHIAPHAHPTHYVFGNYIQGFHSICLADVFNGGLDYIRLEYGSSAVTNDP